MMYPITLTDHERVVVFNLPPPWNVMWKRDMVVRQVIELCFLTYVRSKEMWQVDLESCIYEHFDGVLGEETLVNDDQTMATLHYLNSEILNNYRRYTEGLERVLFCFDYSALDYLTFEVCEYQADIRITIYPKDIK